MKLSVVMPVLDVGDVLIAQLDALVRQRADVPWEVVIADNGTTDPRSLEISRGFADRHERVRIVDASARRGRSAALNIGIAAAASEAVAICDGDDIVAPGWVAAMADALEAHPFVCGPLEYHRLNPAWAVTARGGVEQQRAPSIVEGGPPWPYCAGANVGVQRSWHDAIGGYDETFTYGGEDLDYAWRMHLAGVGLHWAPDAVVHYRLRTRLRDLYRQGRSYAAAQMVLQGRWGHAWPAPPTAPGVGAVLERAVRRAPAVRSRAGLGFWVWSMAWAQGYRRGATLPPTTPLRQTGARDRS